MATRIHDINIHPKYRQFNFKLFQLRPLFTGRDVSNSACQWPYKKLCKICVIRVTLDVNVGFVNSFSAIQTPPFACVINENSIATVYRIIKAIMWMSQ